MLYFFNAHGFQTDQFELLRVGMAETQVEEMMGVPEARWKDGITTIWVYGSSLTFCKSFVTFGEDNRMIGTFHDH